MPSTVAGPRPLAVDLDVLKLGTTEDPVSRDDVERALYALTGWLKPQRLIDAALDVVDSYATQVRAGRVVPAREGHVAVVRRAVVAPVAAPLRCSRAHLDEHTCPVSVELVEVPVSVPATPGSVAEPAVRQVWARSTPTMSPEELLLVADADVKSLSPAQRGARHALMTSSQTCKLCSLVKSLDDFYKDSARLTRRSSRCKDCANASAAARRRKTPS